MDTPHGSCKQVGFGWRWERGGVTDNCPALFTSVFLSYVRFVLPDHYTWLCVNLQTDRNRPTAHGISLICKHVHMKITEDRYHVHGIFHGKK